MWHGDAAMALAIESGSDEHGRMAHSLCAQSFHEHSHVDPTNDIENDRAAEKCLDTPHFNYKHDALLHLDDVKVDLMVMEAKGTEEGGQQDLWKLGLVLSNNILGMHPKMPPGELRAHGIMFIGYSCTLIECQLRDMRPVQYEIAKFDVPSSAGGHAGVLEGLGYFIAFRDRILTIAQRLRKEP